MCRDEKRTFQTHVGTSGWTYDDWEGRFYPLAVKGTARLDYYMSVFDTVEVNATFYRVPNQATIDSWNRRLEPGFHLVAKGPRVVTHFKKLVGCDSALELFLDRVLQLRALDVILWQLPPSLHFDVTRLERFLARLPRNVYHAMEFRHPSWWQARAAAVLERYGVAWVAVSHPSLPPDLFSTADFLYVRFHGLGEQLYRWDYSEDELAPWVERLSSHMASRPLYAFFNNDFEANAPKNAKLLERLLTKMASSTAQPAQVHGPAREKRVRFDPPK